MFGLPVPRHHVYTLYRFGGIAGGHFGYMTLRPDGRVGVYDHPNERQWSLRGNILHLQNEAGETTSRMRHHPDSNCFMPIGSMDLYLLPILKLDKPKRPSHLPPILVNSIPKSGTYFLEAAVAKLGARPTRLHLGNDFGFDYRGVPDEVMHHGDQGEVLSAPIGAVATLLNPGDVAVSHLDQASALEDASREGVHILHVVRNLRDVLMSLYHFKKDVVKPLTAATNAWRALPPQEGFIGFLCQFELLDIAHIARTAELILSRDEPIVRYEDALKGQVSTEAEALLPGLGAALRDVSGQATSTLSKRDRKQQLWTKPADDFFAAFGLEALNKRLGY